MPIYAVVTFLKKDDSRKITNHFDVLGPFQDEVEADKKFHDYTVKVNFSRHDDGYDHRVAFVNADNLVPANVVNVPKYGDYRYRIKFVEIDYTVTREGCESYVLTNDERVKVEDMKPGDVVYWKGEETLTVEKVEKVVEYWATHQRGIGTEEEINERIARRQRY